MRRRPLGLAIAFWLVAASRASAQACAGTPTRDGQTAVYLDAGVSQRRNSYGVSVLADLRGALSIFGGWALIRPRDAATDGDELGTGLALDLAAGPISVCPTIAVAHSRFSHARGATFVTTTTTLVPIGASFGDTMPLGPRFALTGFAFPQIVFARTRVAYEVGALIGSEEGPPATTRELGLDAGIAVSSRALFVAGGVGLSTLAEADPKLTLACGLLVGP